jgi:hypothetical protein
MIHVNRKIGIQACPGQKKPQDPIRKITERHKGLVE